MNAEEKRIEMRLKNKVGILQEEGTCPTCRNFEFDDVYPNDGRAFYEDDKIICLFEQYPRAVGHTIILTKEHYEDISEMPIELGTHILSVTQKIINLLKEKLGAEKVYMCTMCDGKRNHLHFQLLPRFKGETIGSKNFVRERGILKDYEETVQLFEGCMKA
ncbi:MAG: HIT family protein [Clostridia bacterium]|nr:HIT family protein [Clostridia bacterium]